MKLCVQSRNRDKKYSWYSLYAETLFDEAISFEVEATRRAGLPTKEGLKLDW